MPRSWRGTEPLKLLLCRQRKGFKFHYTARKKAVNRKKSFSLCKKPCLLAVQTIKYICNDHYQKDPPPFCHNFYSDSKQQEPPSRTNGDLLQTLLNLGKGWIWTLGFKPAYSTEPEEVTGAQTPQILLSYNLFLMFCGDVIGFRWLKDNLDTDSCQFHLAGVKRYLLGTRKTERCFRWMSKAK